jgi:hypothetical protein
MAQLCLHPLAFGQAGVDVDDVPVPELRDVVTGVDDDGVLGQGAEQPRGQPGDVFLRDGDDHDICLAGDLGDGDRRRAGPGSDVGECLGPAGVGDHDLMAEPGELGGQRGAHVPGADDPDAHGVLLMLLEVRCLGLSWCQRAEPRSGSPANSDPGGNRSRSDGRSLCRSQSSMRVPAGPRFSSGVVPAVA